MVQTQPHPTPPDRPVAACVQQLLLLWASAHRLASSDHNAGTYSLSSSCTQPPFKSGARLRRPQPLFTCSLSCCCSYCCCCCRWQCSSSSSPACDATYEGHVDWVNDVLCYKDRLVTCSSDRAVKIWQADEEGKRARGGGVEGELWGGAGMFSWGQQRGGRCWGWGLESGAWGPGRQAAGRQAKGQQGRQAGRQVGRPASQLLAHSRRAPAVWLSPPACRLHSWLVDTAGMCSTHLPVTPLCSSSGRAPHPRLNQHPGGLLVCCDIHIPPLPPPSNAPPPTYTSPPPRPLPAHCAAPHRLCDLPRCQ